ncbi:MAG: hypothetical protein J5748_00760 [Bacteroidales bacterium]|nr:hypothetical protein [Bacteroidales bacterium]
MSYIQVCLPLKLDWNPWYTTTEEVHVGQRVAVHFARKPYVGVVVSVGGQPDVKTVLPIDSAETGLADITPEEFKLWDFVSSYYMCTLGEVYKAAYPAEKVRFEKVSARMAAKKKTQPAEEPKAFQDTLDFGEKPVLLRGTDRVPYYLDEIRRTLDAGHNVLILEPETDFGFSLRDALARALKGRLMFYGATSGQKEKREVIDAVRESLKPVAVIGVRSTVFLPWNNLGLVIVDEEQDVSFKQSEPAPLYNGRDVAAMLTRLHGARLILGSACPSLESLSNCISGKYELVPVSETLPSVEIIDIPAEKHKRGMVGNYSRRALEEIKALPADALVTVVRCYQTEEDAVAEMRSVIPDRDPQLLTAVAARKSASHSALTLVLQADSLFDKSDFRADEKALQMLCSIRAHTDRLLVQCGASSHPVYKALVSGGLAGLEELLAERKSFKLPPYTRLVDMRDKGSVVRREVLQRDSSLAARKQELKLKYGALYTFDVDPL